jgi:spermidine/putrescine-binding protein
MKKGLSRRNLFKFMAIGGTTAVNAKENDARREAQSYLVNEQNYHNPNLLDCYTCHY